MSDDQVVQIDRSATTFTAVCVECGVSFAGRLDADLSHGTFLCRAGHSIDIVRAGQPAAPAVEETAA
jgi:hypothetical protein